MTGTDRGISDVLAFVLVFATIIGSVGLIYVAGFSSLMGYQEAEQVRNAERAIETLGSNFNAVLEADGVTERRGEIEIREGTIVTDPNSTVLSIDVGEETYQHRLGALRYELGTRVIAYEGGAVVHAEIDDPMASRMVTSPGLVCQPESDTAIVSLLEIERVDGPSTLFSGESREIGVVQTDRYAEAHRFETSGNVTISVDSSPFEGAWNETLERGDWSNGSCEDVDQVIVRTVWVTVML